MRSNDFRHIQRNTQLVNDRIILANSYAKHAHTHTQTPIMNCVSKIIIHKKEIQNE